MSCTHCPFNGNTFGFTPLSLGHWRRVWVLHCKSRAEMICLEIYRCNNTQRGHRFTIKLREKQCCSLSPVSFSASTHPRCLFFSTSSVIRWLWLRGRGVCSGVRRHRGLLLIPLCKGVLEGWRRLVGAGSKAEANWQQATGTLWGTKREVRRAGGAVLLSGRDVTKKTSHDWICSC